MFKLAATFMTNSTKYGTTGIHLRIFSGGGPTGTSDLPMPLLIYVGFEKDMASIATTIRTNVRITGEVANIMRRCMVPGPRRKARGVLGVDTLSGS